MVERERTIVAVAEAFARLPASKRQRRCIPPVGSSLTDTFVSAGAHDGSETVEGVVVDGERLEDGGWDLDADFTLMTTNGELLVCHGYSCHVDVQ